MVTTNFWLVGTSALGVVIFGFIVGLYSILRSIKMKQNLLRIFGFMAILMGMLLLGPAVDFLMVLFTTLFTGTGVNIHPLYLYGILSYMWVAPALIISMYIGATLFAPKAKWYIVGVFTILGIVFEYLLFFDTIGSFDPFVDPLGEDVIDASFNNASLAFILIVIFILATTIFCAGGALRKSFKSTGELKKKFLYISIGFFIFTIAAVIDSLLNIAIILFVARFGFIIDNIFLYIGIK
jgi:hypothetical protein